MTVWCRISTNGRYPFCCLEFGHGKEREVLNGGGGDGVCRCLK